jgi:hypothetical protein
VEQPNVEKPDGAAVAPERDSANLGEFIDEFNQKLEAKTAETPVEPPPAPASSTEPAPNWREVVLTDVEGYDFFNGKKVPDVIQSYKHLENAFQKSQRERNELQRENEQIRRDREADAAARRVNAQPAPEASAAPVSDEAAELEKLIFDDPKEYTRRVKDLAVQEARAAVAQDLRTQSDEATAADRQAWTQKAGNEAVKRAAESYGWDERTAVKRVMGTFAHLAASDDVNAFLRPENYLAVLEELHGPPPARPSAAAPVEIPAVLEPSDPPGSKRAAPAQRRGPSQSSPLTSEREDAIRVFASAGGHVDPEKVIARQRARQNNGGARG